MEEAKNKTNHVLILDDDVLIRKELKKELQRRFYQVQVAGDAKQAKEILASGTIDIMLLDVNLPDVNGLTLLKQIKDQSDSNVEIIMITGCGSLDVAIQSLRMGAIDYIDKPINIEELAAALGRAGEKILEKKSLQFKNTLLIVDDDETVIRYMKRFLTKEGFDVLVALNGKAAQDILDVNKVDVVISDINMEETSGIEVLKTAKKLYKDIEVIMITGEQDESQSIESLRAGAFDYISKPINMDELCFSLQRAIERINLNRTKLYRGRELKITSEIITKMNQELEERVETRTQALSKVQSQLFQTSKLAVLGEMSAGLAHEINQPLGGISLISTTFRKLQERDKMTAEELYEGLDEIDHCVTRMSKIIQHIRTFARQDTFKFIEVDVNKSLDSALALLRLHEIKLVLNLDEKIPSVMGEPYQIEQVWINLISNARDALDDRGKKEEDPAYEKVLTISTRALTKKKEVEVTFADNGMGMDPETLKKLFEPFFTTKEVGRGSGLGLSISYGIIESHKGDIKAESKRNVGTKIIVTLAEEFVES